MALHIFFIVTMTCLNINITVLLRNLGLDQNSFNRQQKSSVCGFENAQVSNLIFQTITVARIFPGFLSPKSGIQTGTKSAKNRKTPRKWGR